MKVFTAVALALSTFVLTPSAIPTTIGSSDGLVQVSTDSRTHGSTHGTPLSTRAIHGDSCCGHPKKKRVENHEHSEGQGLGKNHLPGPGLPPPAHAGVDIPDIPTPVKAEASIAISGKVDADAKAMVLDKIRGHARKIIAKYCGRDEQCLNRQAKPIARDIEGLVRRDVDALFASYKRHLLG
ncbi:hypothetical protein BGX34_004917 [Mortierella sp. NVP85]|nr:hypothetical protein BGX34_004917 [Mortierella sp. NVP85]